MTKRIMAWIFALAATSSLVWTTGVVRADWDPGPTKFVQYPDLTPNGLDVNATFWDLAQPQFPYIKLLADDFLCTTPGPITDIHIWGSWLEDRQYEAASFKLSIHSDVPATPDSPSHPGPELWSRIFKPGEYTGRLYAEDVRELVYEPNTDSIIGKDSKVFQYNFIDIQDPFFQQGTPNAPVIYWLDVQVLAPPPYVFGWKTSFQHFNDDAVFADTKVFGGPPVTPWKDMHYPFGHPLYPRSIDLAFAITTTSQTASATKPEPARATLVYIAGVSLASASVLGVWLRRRKALSTPSRLA